MGWLRVIDDEHYVKHEIHVGASGGRYGAERVSR